MNSLGKIMNRIKWGGPRVIIFLGLYLMVSLVQLPIRLINDASRVWVNLIWAAVYFAVFGFAIWIARRAYSDYGYHRPQRVTRSDLWLIVKCYVFAIVVEIALNQCNFLVNHQVSSKNNELIFRLLSSDRLILVIMTVSMVCLSPILEELVFRGYLMDAFFGPRFFWLPIVFSGVIFASGHLVSNWISFAVYVSLGMFLAYVYRRTGNIRVSILMHAFNNLISVIPILIVLLR